MKKVLLTSAVALAAFGAVQAVSADRQDPGIRYPGESLPTKKDGGVQVIDENGNVSNLVKSLKKYEVRVNDQGVRAVASENEPFTFEGRTIGWDLVTTYSDGSTSTVFLPNDKGDKDEDGKPLPAATNPYDSQFNLDKDGKVVKPIRYGNGTHVRVTVKDYQGNPVPGVKVAALVYATVEDFDNHKKPAPVELVSDAAGDVEFPVKDGGYVVYRVDEAPKGYHVPNKLVNGTLLDAEEVVRQGGDMFVTGTLYVEKTDTYNVARTEWVQGENGWHYFDNNKQATGWKQIDGKWYFFNAEGVMQKWWVKDGNTWYYLNGSGAMETGWLQDGGKWYFLEASGAMKASQWFEVAGKWYYVDGSGALAVNTTVGGYTVNGNGEWVN